MAELIKTFCGTISLAGRPNVGKSTLINQIVDDKVTIVSDRAQTTRRPTRAVLTDKDRQIIFCDLPGYQRPLDALTRGMQRHVDEEIRSTDHALMVVNAQQGVGGKGDKFIADLLIKRKTPVTIAVNKFDLIGKQRRVNALLAAQELGLEAEIFPISAKTGDGVSQLVEALYKTLPPGPFHFDVETRADSSERELIAEVIREQLLQRAKEELPHALAVEVTNIERNSNHTTIEVAIWVERKTQRAIVIGKGGQMIKEVGVAARGILEKKLNCRLYLDLNVQVKRQWRTNPEMVARVLEG